MDHFKVALQNFAKKHVPFVQSEYQIHVLVASSCLALLFLKVVIKIVLRCVLDAERWTKSNTETLNAGDAFTITPAIDEDNGVEEKWLGTKQLARLLTVHKITMNGLVGILVKGPVATIVEVNCMNENLIYDKTFQKLVHSLAFACTEYASKISVYRNAPTINKVYWASDQLREFQTIETKDVLKDICKKCEDIVLKRAFSFRVTKGIRLFGYTYPRRLIKGGTYSGKFGAVVALKAGGGGCDVQELGKKLCQHIICNNPIKIGTNTFMNSALEEDYCLMQQAYMHNEKSKVGDVLKQNDVEVLDFKRFICGEPNPTNEVPL